MQLEPVEGHLLTNSSHTQIIALSTLSWHTVLPRLMSYEVIDSGLSPDKSLESVEREILVDSYFAYGCTVAHE